MATKDKKAPSPADGEKSPRDAKYLEMERSAGGLPDEPDDYPVVNPTPFTKLSGGR